MTIHKREAHAAGDISNRKHEPNAPLLSIHGQYTPTMRHSTPKQKVKNPPPRWINISLHLFQLRLPPPPVTSPHTHALQTSPLIGNHSTGPTDPSATPTARKVIDNCAPFHVSIDFHAVCAILKGGVAVFASRRVLEMLDVDCRGKLLHRRGRYLPE